jgi:hypothetical protein
MNRTDSLGQSYNLTGFQAYCSVNNNLDAMGSSVLADAPVLNTPDALLTTTITLTSASFSIAYTPTPIVTGAKLFVFASPQRSAGRNFEGDYRLIFVSAASAASPANVLSAYSARFGAPVTGNKIFVSLVVCDGGFESGPLLASKVVA